MATIYGARIATTVHAGDSPEPFDTARKVRGVMAEEFVTATDLSRSYGGAVTYWTRRVTGQLPFTAQDLHLIGLATRRHPAEFMGGQPPAGWTPPPTPLSDPRDSIASSARSSTDRASDYGSLVRLPARAPSKRHLALVRDGDVA